MRTPELVGVRRFSGGLPVRRLFSDEVGLPGATALKVCATSQIMSAGVFYAAKTYGSCT